MKFFTHRKQPFFQSQGGESDMFGTPTKFLMARKEGIWFFAIENGELIPEQDLFYSVFNDAVEFGDYTEVNWPEDWKPLIGA